MIHGHQLKSWKAHFALLSQCIPLQSRPKSLVWDQLDKFCIKTAIVYPTYYRPEKEYFQIDSGRYHPPKYGWRTGLYRASRRRGWEKETWRGGAIQDSPVSWEEGHILKQAPPLPKSPQWQWVRGFLHQFLLTKAARRMFSGHATFPRKIYLVLQLVSRQTSMRN